MDNADLDSAVNKTTVITNTDLFDLIVLIVFGRKTITIKTVLYSNMLSHVIIIKPISAMWTGHMLHDPQEKWSNIVTNWYLKEWQEKQMTPTNKIGR